MEFNALRPLNSSQLFVNQLTGDQCLLSWKLIQNVEHISLMRPIFNSDTSRNITILFGAWFNTLQVLILS